MRISTEFSDPGFREDANMLDIRVMLDGVEVTTCFTCDSDKGEVWLGAKLPGREPIEAVRENRDCWTKYLYRGKVEIIENGTERKL